MLYSFKYTSLFKSVDMPTLISKIPFQFQFFFMKAYPTSTFAPDLGALIFAEHNYAPKRMDVFDFIGRIVFPLVPTSGQSLQSYLY